MIEHLRARPAGPVAPRPARRTALLAATSAVTAANVYLNQPLLAAAAHDLRVAPATLGAVPTATQLGYAAGIALLVPAGDSHDRRPLILALGAAGTLALTACALAPGAPWLVVASLLLGLSSPVPQLVAPLALALATDGRPGRTVGVVQGGLLLGVLASRAYAGALAELCGWRAVYGCSALLTLLLTGVLWRRLPAGGAPPGAPSYRAALASLPRLFTGEALVRRVTLCGALVGVSFGAFWTALTFLLTQHRHAGPTEVGLFGLVAAASALASPAAGRVADRIGQRGALAALTAVVLAGWALLLPGGDGLGALIAGVVVLDVGTWGQQVVCQSILFTLAPGAHSRLNTCYFTLRFAGIAVGSLAGSLAWRHGGWPAVVPVSA
ncbi:MFS transporter, partial [Kitasatospora nipponensis]|uniref:MFS transporter n=1 Tax=Kitasatospora nipponensis TaxID=258049 RepID=UPI0031D9934E